MFRIQESFSGVDGAFVDVCSDRSSCGVDFEPGESYLVDAHQGRTGEHHCHHVFLDTTGREGTEEIRMASSCCIVPLGSS